MKYPLEDTHAVEDVSDEGIRQQVCTALRNSSIPGEENVEVYVSDGIVVLEGDINDESTSRIEDLVKSVHHVKGIMNRLQPLRL